MSAHAEIMDAAELVAPVQSYDRVMKAVHWLNLLCLEPRFVPPVTFGRDQHTCSVGKRPYSSYKKLPP